MRMVPSGLDFHQTLVYFYLNQPAHSHKRGKMKKNSSLLDHSCILLLYVFLLSMLLTCIASPFIKVLLDRGLDASLALSRVMSRCFIAFSLLLFCIYRKRFKSGVGESLNYTHHPWLKHLLFGFAVGLGSLVIMTIIMIIMGIAEIELQSSLIETGGKLLK